MGWVNAECEFRKWVTILGRVTSLSFPWNVPPNTPADDEIAFSQHASNQGSINKTSKVNAEGSRAYFKHFFIHDIQFVSPFGSLKVRTTHFRIAENSFHAIHQHYVKNEPSDFVSTIASVWWISWRPFLSQSVTIKPGQGKCHRPTQDFRANCECLFLRDLL